MKDGFTVDGEAWNLVSDVHQAFRKIVSFNNGDIKTVGVHADVVKIAAEIPNMDLFRDRLDAFMELLEIVDSFDVTATNADTLIVEIGVKF